MDGAPGRHAHIAREPPHQEFADLARPPMRLAALEVDNQALDLPRQLVGVAHRPPRAVGEGFEPMRLVAIEDFVAGLARDAELATDIRHRLAIHKLADKSQALVHDRTLLQRHQHLPPKGEKCYPCVRYEMSPMSQAAQRFRARFWAGTGVSVEDPVCKAVAILAPTASL